MYIFTCDGTHNKLIIPSTQLTPPQFPSFHSCILLIPANMEWLFGKRMTPDEMLRKNQRALNKAMRDLDREKMKMEQQEKKIIADIKKLAKEGQMDAVKIMAKDLVRTRRYSICNYRNSNDNVTSLNRYTKKFMLMKANIQAVSLKIQTLKSQNTMAEAMKGLPISHI